MDKRFSWAAAALLVLGGCVTPPVDLKPQLQQQLDSVQPIAFIPQANLDVDVTPGSAVAGGLIGALIVAAIDESRRTTAQKASVGLVDALRDFGFRDRMPRQMDAEFARLRLPRMAGPVRLETTDSESQRRILLDSSRANAVLFTSVTYKLVDSKLVVFASSVMYPKAQKLMAFRPTPSATNALDPGNAIYRKTFVYRSEIIARDRIHQSLADGMANIAWQIASDMAHVAGTGDGVHTAALAPLPAGGAATGALQIAVRPQPAAIAVAAASPNAAAAPALPSDMPATAPPTATRFKGPMRCGPWLGTPGAATNPNGWTANVEMSLQGGKATMVRGDDAYREVLIGDVSTDGMLTLQGQGALFKSPQLPWKNEVFGRFEPNGMGRFIGGGKLMNMRGTVTRECTVDLLQIS